MFSWRQRSLAPPWHKVPVFAESTKIGTIPALLKMRRKPRRFVCPFYLRAAQKHLHAMGRWFRWMSPLRIFLAPSLPTAPRIPQEAQEAMPPANKRRSQSQEKCCAGFADTRWQRRSEHRQKRSRITKKEERNTTQIPRFSRRWTRAWTSAASLRCVSTIWQRSSHHQQLNSPRKQCTLCLIISTRSCKRWGTAYAKRSLEDGRC